MRKLLSDYGMVLILIVLCLLFSALTFKEQTPLGNNAIIEIVEQIKSRFVHCIGIKGQRHREE